MAGADRLSSVHFVTRKQSHTTAVDSPQLSECKTEIPGHTPGEFQGMRILSDSIEHQGLLQDI